MKPGHTIFWRRKDGIFVQGTCTAGGTFHHSAEDYAVELASLMEANAFGTVDVFDVNNGQIVESHEMDYMKQNSKMYERS